MTPGQAARLVAFLRTMFWGNKVDDAAIAGLEALLLDVPYDICHRVLRRLVQTCTFFPAWSEIHKACLLEIEGPRKTALQAWGDVGVAVRRFGRYQAPLFSDPLTARCVASFGWREVCDSTNEVADRAHFTREYERLVEQEERELGSLTLTERQMLRAATATVHEFPLPQVEPHQHFDFDMSEASHG